MNTIDDTKFIDILKDGINRTSYHMNLLTNFHGGPTETEYILTVAIARAFLEKKYEAHVEFPNRRLVNNMTKRRDIVSCTPFRSKRTDVAVTNSGLIPMAMVEVKIRVGGTLTPVKEDLVKIARTLLCMKAKIAANVRSASVFQVHVPGTAKDIKTDKLQKKMSNIEVKLECDLILFAKDWPDFNFKLVSLQGTNGGFVPTEVYYDEDGLPCLGEDGHVTRYYAILITSVRQSTASTLFEELKKGD